MILRERSRNIDHICHLSQSCDYKLVFAFSHLHYRFQYGFQAGDPDVIVNRAKVGNEICVQNVLTSPASCSKFVLNDRSRVRIGLATSSGTPTSDISAL